MARRSPLRCKNKVGFKGTLKEFFTFMREDPQFLFPTTDERREAYLEAPGSISRSSTPDCRTQG
ncbi:MAG: hypothetical protein H0W53_07565 [Acidobacteria bacterium]|nr:hypothetical protein [Acidobacteriota bacterium]